MLGTHSATVALFSYVGLEDRGLAPNPLRKVREIVNDALASLAEFDRLYSTEGRTSDAPERLIRARSWFRSERQLMEEMQDNRLFRRFVGLGIDSEADKKATQ